MTTVGDVLDLLLVALQFVVAFVIGYVMSHPLPMAFALVAFVRQFGTTVRSGSKGVLFVWGHVRRELEPGFHPLVPVMMAVRKTPVRSITLELPHQRVTTADGFVYDVQANIVYRVADPARALTEIDNLRHGIEVKLALIAADLLRGLTRDGVLRVKALEAELLTRAEQQLGRWGVTVEQAGFTSIAPTKKTVHVTQLAMRSAEREQALNDLAGHGVPPTAAIALLAADRRLICHATARYRALHRTARLAPPTPLPAAVALPTSVQTPTPLLPAQAQSEPTLTGAPADQASKPAAARAKKITKGMQPRTWLRLKHRLRRQSAP